MKKYILIICLLIVLTACKQTEITPAPELEQPINTKAAVDMVSAEDFENLQTKYENRVQLINELKRQVGNLNEDISSLQINLDNKATEVEELQVFKTDYKDTLDEIKKLEATMRVAYETDELLFESIYEELDGETLMGIDNQELYNQIKDIKSREFKYIEDGRVYIITETGNYIFDWDEVDDINIHYQELINKFMQLYKNKKDVISDDDMLEAGFSWESLGYGILTIYGDRDELYKSYCRNYIYRRADLESALLRYRNGDCTADDVETSYPPMLG